MRETSSFGNGVISNNSTFKYDGDGNRVYAATADATTLHPFPMVEYRMETTPVAVKYYMAGSQRVAMREGTTAYYFLQDHLGSTALTLDSSGVKVGETRYDVWGKTIYQSNTMHTNRLYTGQLWDGKVQDDGTGLYFYNARYYDPALGRFTQADTIVPEPGNPQTLNRFSYTLNNPIRYVDPTGHQAVEDSCAGQGTACYEERWYKAHGYEKRGLGWEYTGNFFLADVQISLEILAEAGITMLNSISHELQAGGGYVSTAWEWSGAEIMTVASAVMDLSSAIGEAGLSTLNKLMGGVEFIRGNASPCGSVQNAAACAYPNGRVYFQSHITKFTVIHEIAHVMDNNSYVAIYHGSYLKEGRISSAFPQGALITSYSGSSAQEYWAESLVDWLYGLEYMPQGEQYDPSNPASTRHTVSPWQSEIIWGFLNGQRFWPK